MEITSVNNELVKEAVKLQQKKYRTQSGKFLLEGFKAIKEAIESDIVIENIFVNKNKTKEYDLRNKNIIETTELVLKKISTTDSAPDIVGVGVQKKYDIDILKQTKKVLLLEGIKDLGNLGTIIRSSVAFGVDAIILYGDSVDIYNPKSVRASVGNLWKIPILNLSSIQDLKKYFDKFERVATLPRSEYLLKNFTPKYPLLIMFGSEADGLSDELINFSTTSVKIEMEKTVESLNLGVSAGIILYNIM